MKYIIRYTLSIIVLLNFNIKSHAYDFAVDGIYYNVTSFTDMTCSVTSGDVEYTGDIIIPANVTYKSRILTVTSIGSYAFHGCSSLTSITIPNSVKSIENDTFNNCSGLTSITIPNSVTSIGSSAFCDCANLTSITIPNSVTSIRRAAFSNCSSLTSVTIPNSVTNIEGAVFLGCSGLTSITIPNSVTNIEEFAFYGCSGLANVTIPNSVTSIGRSAFRDCSSLTSITFPNSVKSIGFETFRDCSSLMSIIIPNSVTSIEGAAFYGCCNIKSLIINDGEEQLELSYNSYGQYGPGEGMFYDCPLEYLYIGRELDYKNDWEYGYYPFYNNKKSITEIAFGKYITKIPIYTKDFSELETITLYNPTPPSVSSIYFTNAQYMNMNVYVPKGSLEAYQKADVWKNFWGLQEKDLARIETVVADDNNTDNVIYDMQGRRLDAPKAGLNIINGKKMIIRK